MLGGLCICALIPSPPIATATRVVLLIHRDEERKPTNTGLLAVRCLANAHVVVRGREGERDAPVSGARPLLLFPGEDATPLVARPAEPVTLIVPDGVWRQAAKARQRVPGLRDAPCVMLPPGEPSRYRLRHEPRPGGLATFEAIARALEILEGGGVRAALDPIFRAMVERTLWARGAIDAGEVESGIPDGVRRDDPAGGRAMIT
jgi:tRNA-uridine aminocarboxypropyltransferase